MFLREKGRKFQSIFVFNLTNPNAILRKWEWAIRASEAVKAVVHDFLEYSFAFFRLLL